MKYMLICIFLACLAIPQASSIAHHRASAPQPALRWQAMGLPEIILSGGEV